MVDPTGLRQPTKEARLVELAKAVGRINARVVTLENAPGGGGASAWGDITGTLSNQTGLQTALNARQPLSTVLTNTTASFTAALESKLAGIAAGATANSTDAQLRDRTTHTGEQVIATVTGLQTALDAKIDDSQVTAFSLTLLDDTNATAWRGTLGLGTAATSATGDFAAASHVGSGGAAHANVVASGAAGFMTGADKAKLDAITGTNTGDQTTITGNAGSATILQTGRTIGMTGDVVWTSPSFNGSANVTAAGTIQNDVVSNAKLANVATATFKGRVTAATGDPEDLTGTQATTLLDVFTSGLKGLAPASGGGTVNFLRADGTWAAPSGGGGVSDGDKGDITVASGGTVWTIDAQAVTLAKMADVATSTLFYRKTAGSGAPETQTLATLKTDLGLTGTNSGDQTITLTGDVTGTGGGSFATTIANDVVTYAKMQNVSAASRLLGRGDSGSGDPQEITLGANLTMTGAVLSATGGGGGTFDYGITYAMAAGHFGA